VYECEHALEKKPKLPGGDIFRRIGDTREERYHLLESIPQNLDKSGIGIPDLIIDFRRFHTIAPKEIYRQCDLIDGAKRRCRLEMPYREHLQFRAAFYFQRVVLPVPHAFTSRPQTT
jgi:hypothetical protein